MTRTGRTRPERSGAHERSRSVHHSALPIPLRPDPRAPGRTPTLSFVRSAAALLAVVTALSCGTAPGTVPAPPEPAGSRTEPVPVPVIPPSLRWYIARRAPAVPVIDGRLDDAAWDDVAWTEPFMDIEGARQPAPRFGTRVRMMWDDASLYIGAALAEPDLQASLVERDAVIFRDNDFEVFLDPDGDTHDYVELEINALGTQWDLRLPKPYRDGGRPDNAWDITGLHAAVALDGTLNDASDRDGGWSVEIAVPFASLGLEPPRDGAQWRVNFSRVEWAFDTVDGSYRKRIDRATGKPLPESNWTWSPQYAVNMHMPELWGIVQFSTARPGGRSVSFASPSDEVARWGLRRVYYAERAFQRAHRRWTERLDELALDGLPSGVSLTVDSSAGTWQAEVTGESGARWRIRADGRIARDERGRQ